MMLWFVKTAIHKKQNNHRNLSLDPHMLASSYRPRSTEGLVGIIGIPSFTIFYQICARHTYWGNFVPYRVIKKNLTQNEINIKNTSDTNVSIKYAYTDRQNCFLSITKTIMCFHCSVQKI